MGIFIYRGFLTVLVKEIYGCPGNKLSKGGHRMKQFIIPALVMLGILIIFLLVGGLPRPGDIHWENTTWRYAGRDKGVITYKSTAGKEFTVDPLPGDIFILGIDGKDYTASFTGRQVEINFPDGGKAAGQIVVFLEEITRVIFPIPVEISAHEISVFYLAAEVDRVFPSKISPIGLAIIVWILGALQYRYPLTFSEFALAGRAWMVKDPEPTGQFVVFTKIVGGVLMIGSWIFMLAVVWK